MLRRLKIATYFLVATSTTSAQHTAHDNRDAYDSDSLRIVIYPFMKKEIDDPIHAVFGQSKFKVADSARIAHNLRNHELFNNTSRKMIAAVSGKTKNIYTGLTEEEIEDFKNNTVHKGFVLFHLEITLMSLTKARGAKFYKLSGDVLAYDVSSGQFVVKCSASPKVQFYAEAEGRAYAIRKFVEETVPCFSSRLK